MKTLADIKRRLSVGVKLLCVENTYRPELNGTVRTVTRVLSNQIVWTWDGGKKPGEPNWTRWPSAKAFAFVDADTFTFMLDEHGVFSNANDKRVTLRFIS